MICFRFFGVKIYLWFSFFAIISLLLVLSKNDLIIYGVAAAIIHELGHLTAFLVKGYPPKEIHLEYSGIRLIPQRNLFSFKDESIILLSGSAFNMIFFVLFYKLIKIWAFMHLILGVFNLLPMKTLDGGQFVLMVTQKLFGVKKGILISDFISITTEILLITAGVFLFFKTGNFTLILTVIHLLFLSIFAK